MKVKRKNKGFWKCVSQQKPLFFLLKGVLKSKRDKKKPFKSLLTSKAENEVVIISAVQQRSFYWTTT